MGQSKEAIVRQIEKAKAEKERLEKLLKAREQADRAKERKRRDAMLYKIGGTIVKYTGELNDEQIASLDAYVKQYTQAIVRACNTPVPKPVEDEDTATP